MIYNHSDVWRMDYSGGKSSNRPVRRLVTRPVRRTRQETMITWARIVMVKKDKWSDLEEIRTALSTDCISLTFIDYTI